MNSVPVIVSGFVRQDGTLELEEKLSLPPGKVQISIQPVPELPSDDPFWQMMQKIWDGQKARGHAARSEEEVEAERRQVREDWDERMRRIAMCSIGDGWGGVAPAKGVVTHQEYAGEDRRQE